MFLRGPTVPPGATVSAAGSALLMGRPRSITVCDCCGTSLVGAFADTNPPTRSSTAVFPLPPEATLPLSSNSLPFPRVLTLECCPPSPPVLFHPARSAQTPREKTASVIRTSLLAILLSGNHYPTPVRLTPGPPSSCQTPISGHIILRTYPRHWARPGRAIPSVHTDAGSEHS